MSSAIDATKPVDNVKASKADLRANLLAAKNEIEDLQRKVSLPWQSAFVLNRITSV